MLYLEESASHFSAILAVFFEPYWDEALEFEKPYCFPFRRLAVCSAQPRIQQRRLHQDEHPLLIQLRRRAFQLEAHHLFQLIHAKLRGLLHVLAPHGSGFGIPYVLFQVHLQILLVLAQDSAEEFLMLRQVSVRRGQVYRRDVLSNYLARLVDKNSMSAHLLKQ
jgi:hypothetical protein